MENRKKRKRWRFRDTRGPEASACPRGGAHPDDRCPRVQVAQHSDDPWTPSGPLAYEVAPVWAAPVPLFAYVGTHGKLCSLRRRRCPDGSPVKRRTSRNTRHRTSKTPTGSDTFHAGGTTVSRREAPAHRSRTADTTAEYSTPLSF